MCMHNKQTRAPQKQTHAPPTRRSSTYIQTRRNIDIYSVYNNGIYTATILYLMLATEKAVAVVPVGRSLPTGPLKLHKQG